MEGLPLILRHISHSAPQREMCYNNVWKHLSWPKKVNGDILLTIKKTEMMLKILAVSCPQEPKISDFSIERIGERTDD